MFEEYIIAKNDDSPPIEQSNLFENILFHSIGIELNAILITPICDIQEEKDYEYLHFCAIYPYEPLLFFEISKKSGIPKDELREKIKSTKGEEIIEKYKSKIFNQLLDMISNKMIRFHWLGKIPNKDDYWFVDYAVTNCMERSKLDENKRIAIIKSPLRESVFVRYSSCMGRVGLKGEHKEKKAYRDEVFKNSSKTLLSA